MVKIRGHRVELEEVEKCLMACNYISLVLASVPQDGPFANSLVAVVTTKDWTGEKAAADNLIRELDPEEASWCSSHSKILREYAVKSLPSYMLPDSFRFLEKMPFSSSGKIK